MKRWISACLIAVCLMLCLLPTAYADEGSALFAEEGASVRYLDFVGSDYAGTAMLCFDGDGYVIAVKEAVLFAEGVDAAKRLAQWAPSIDTPYTLEDGIAYRTYSPREVRRTFGRLFPADLAKYLDMREQAGAAAPAPATQPLTGTLYSGNGLIVTARELQSGDGTLAVTVDAQNTGKQPVRFRLSETYVNGWLLSTDAADVTLDAGETRQVTVNALHADLYAFSRMQIAKVRQVRMRVEVLNQKNRVIGASLFKTLINPAAPTDDAQVYDDGGTVLLDDASVKVVLLDCDPRCAQALLHIEKKDAAKWTHIGVETVCDGLRLDHTAFYRLEKGDHVLHAIDWNDMLLKSGADAAESVTAYLQVYYSNRTAKPVAISIAGTAQAAALPESEYPVVFENDRIVLRSMGKSAAWFTDAEALLFACDNKTDELIFVGAPNGFLLSDGARIKVATVGGNCYPHARSVIALYPTEQATWGEAEAAVLRLGMYRLDGSYHKPLGYTGKLTVPLG